MYLPFWRATKWMWRLPAAVFFGAKRHISVRPFPRYWLMISLAWNLLAKRSIRKHGFLHAVYYRMGSDSISARDHAETDAWVRAGTNGSIGMTDLITGRPFANEIAADSLPSRQKGPCAGASQRCCLLAKKPARIKTKRYWY
jgi:hypothetical protein